MVIIERNSGAMQSPYDEIASSLSHTPWYNDDELLSLVLEVAALQPGSRFLDIGCGAGQYLKAAESNGAKVVGVDNSKEMVRLARERCGKAVEVKLGDISDLVPNIGVFDVVLEKNVLHLMPDLVLHAIALRELVGDKGRLVIVETVSPSRAANRFVRRLFAIAGIDYAKRHFFVGDEWMAIMEEVGFRKVESLFFEQHLKLKQWLSAKQVDEWRIKECEELLRNADRGVADDMQIRQWNSGDSSDWQMLRLQSIGVFEVE